MNYKWILCPICGNKTRLRIRVDTILKNFPLYCPKRINLLRTEKIIKTWKGGNSHVKYEKNRTNSPL
ncbi:cysteine-rich KTR domain-containing protein [Streptococcus parasanguinis]|uniref:cysteine-rich KTR domain-containing protein n=1 Tax=Streptococcus parasanguinis TaxID=1318 RepID=UPI0039C9BDB8